MTLRPGGRVPLDDVALLVPPRDAPIRALWSATATNATGQASGEFTIEVVDSAPAAVWLNDVLAEDHDDEPA